MSDMDSQVVTNARSSRFQGGVLAELELASGTLRAWTGSWELTTSDAKVWQPIGEYGGISLIESASALEAPAFTMEIRSPAADNAADEAAFITAFKAAVDEDVFGRSAAVYVQNFNLATMALVSSPQAVRTGRMTHISADWTAGTAVARVHVEHPMAWAGAVPHAFLTDPDQEARNAGDRACFLAALLPTREAIWPRLPPQD